VTESTKHVWLQDEAPKVTVVADELGIRLTVRDGETVWLGHWEAVEIGIELIQCAERTRHVGAWAQSETKGRTDP
jgi:hypothetical protein